MLWRNKQSEPQNYRVAAQQLALVVRDVSPEQGVVTIWRYDEAVCRHEPYLWREEVEAFYLTRQLGLPEVTWLSTCNLPLPTAGQVLLLRASPEMTTHASNVGWLPQMTLPGRKRTPDVVIMVAQ